jgi:hypothetical protein
MAVIVIALSAILKKAAPAIVSMAQMGDKQPRWCQLALIVVGTAGTILGGLFRARA